MVRQKLCCWAPSQSLNLRVTETRGGFLRENKSDIETANCIMLIIIFHETFRTTFGCVSKENSRMLYHTIRILKDETQANN